jgi:hypothetical protein
MMMMMMMGACESGDRAGQAAAHGGAPLHFRTDFYFQGFDLGTNANVQPM